MSILKSLVYYGLSTYFRMIFREFHLVESIGGWTTKRRVQYNSLNGPPRFTFLVDDYGRFTPTSENSLLLYLDEVGHIELRGIVRRELSRTEQIIPIYRFELDETQRAALRSILQPEDATQASPSVWEIPTAWGRLASIDDDGRNRPVVCFDWMGRKNERGYHTIDEFREILTDARTEDVMRGALQLMCRHWLDTGGSGARGPVDEWREMSLLTADGCSALINILRDQCIEDVSLLRRYAAGSSEVYGELLPRFVDEIIQRLHVGPSDTVVDIGCGIGSVLIQCALQTGCRAKGVEIRAELVEIGEAMMRLVPSEFATLTDTPSDEQTVSDFIARRLALVHGDATDPSVMRSILSDATVVIINNPCFSEELEQNVLALLYRFLPVGARVVTIRDLSPRYRPESRRFAHDKCSMFEYPWEKHTTPPDSVSWTAAPISYHVYTVKQPRDSRYANLLDPSANAASIGMDDASVVDSAEWYEYLSADGLRRMMLFSEHPHDFDAFVREICSMPDEGFVLGHTPWDSLSKYGQYDSALGRIRHALVACIYTRNRASVPRHVPYRRWDTVWGTMAMAYHALEYTAERSAVHHYHVVYTPTTRPVVNRTDSSVPSFAHTLAVEITNETLRGAAQVVLPVVDDYAISKYGTSQWTLSELDIGLVAGTHPMSDLVLPRHLYVPLLDDRVLDLRGMDRDITRETKHQTYTATNRTAVATQLSAFALPFLDRTSGILLHHQNEIRSAQSDEDDRTKTVLFVAYSRTHVPIGCAWIHYQKRGASPMQVESPVDGSQQFYATMVGPVGSLPYEIARRQDRTLSSIFSVILPCVIGWMKANNIDYLFTEADVVTTSVLVQEWGFVNSSAPGISYPRFRDIRHLHGVGDRYTNSTDYCVYLPVYKIV